MKLITTAEAAAALGVSIRRVQALITEGTLPADKVGRDYVIRLADLKRVTVYGKRGRPKKAAATGADGAQSEPPAAKKAKPARKKAREK